MSSSAGYSGTPLVRKLGLKPGMRVRLFEPPDDYWELLGGGPEDLEITLLDPGRGPDADFTHIFAAVRATLERSLSRARPAMARDGMVWISWPKKSSGVETDVDRVVVMSAGHEAGLVDVKVCAVDETWSALKFVIPVADR